MSDSTASRNVPGQFAVLVTGASKGIGEACALRLAADGWRVYAGVRRDEDGAALVARAGRSVIPLRLDVTQQDQIDAAARRIGDETGERGLTAVINNAGVAVAGPLEFLPLDELRRQIEVNFTGQLAVTQACLPLLRRARAARPADTRSGRILFMSSVAGRSALPFMGAYAASKFALEAAADALRLELEPFGIAVVLIEPGVIATPIWETSRERAERNIERMPPQLTQFYGPALDALRERAGQGGIPPARVADVVARALAASRPRARYVVGRDARTRILVQSLLPDRIRDRIVAAAVRRFTRAD